MKSGRSPSKEFLRSSREMNFTVNKGFLNSGAQLEKLVSPRSMRSSEMQIKYPALTGRKNRQQFDSIKKSMNQIEKVASRRHTLGGKDEMLGDLIM